MEEQQILIGKQRAEHVRNGCQGRVIGLLRLLRFFLLVYRINISHKHLSILIGSVGVYTVYPALMAIREASSTRQYGRKTHLIQENQEHNIIAEACKSM